MTPMARSTGPVRNNVPPGSFRHAASNTEYSIARDGVVAMINGRDRKEDRFDFVIGSGAAGFSYLIFVAAIFSRPQPLGIHRRTVGCGAGIPRRPGHDLGPAGRSSCLLCHASQITHIYVASIATRRAPFRQSGIFLRTMSSPRLRTHPVESKNGGSFSPRRRAA